MHFYETPFTTIILSLLVALPFAGCRDHSPVADKLQQAETYMLVWTCYYENGSVYLNVPFEIDSVALTVTNTTTGEVWTLLQESVLGWISLPTSEVQGNYMVEVKTEHHGEYMGFPKHLNFSTGQTH